MYFEAMHCFLMGQRPLDCLLYDIPKPASEGFLPVNDENPNSTALHKITKYNNLLLTKPAFDCPYLLPHLYVPQVPDRKLLGL